MPEHRLQRTREAYAQATTLRAVPVGTTGMAIRFVRDYDVEADKYPTRHYGSPINHWNTIEPELK